MPNRTECSECASACVAGANCPECGAPVFTARRRDTYRRESDVDREIGRESRATGIHFRTLRAGSR